MNPGIDYYMNSGLPATALLTFTRAPNTNPPSSATLAVTIGTYTYTWYPVGSTSTPDFVGMTASELAKSLCAAINAQQNRCDLISAVPGPNMLPIKSHCAMYFGNSVCIIATVPGLAGNAIGVSVSTSDPGCYSILNTATTLAGGSPLLPTLARTQFLMTAPGSSNGQAQISTTSKPFQTAYFYGVKSYAQIGVTTGYVATANSATVYTGELVAGKINYSDPVANSLIPTIISAPAGAYLDLINFWLLTPTSGDNLFVKYL